MGNHYVYENGTNSGTQDTWATAYTSLHACLTDTSNVTAGDVVYVDHTHNEDYGAASSMTTAGSSDSPVFVYSVDRNGSTTDSGGDYTPGAHFSTGAGARNLTMSGGCKYFYGVSFSAGGHFSASSDGSGNYNTNYYYDADITVLSTSSHRYIQCATGTSVFHRCQFDFNNVTQGLNISNQAQMRFYDCNIKSGSSAITKWVLIWTSNSNRGQVYMENCDMTNMGAGDLFADPVKRGGYVYASNCLLSANSEVVAGMGTGFEDVHRIEGYNCSTVADDNPNSFKIVDAMGIAIYDGERYLDTDNAFSFYVTTSANSVAPNRPFRFLLGEVYAGAGAKIGVELITEDTLRTDEFWIDVVYPPVTPTGWASGGQTATTLRNFDEVVDPVTPSVPNRSPTASTAANLATSSFDGTDWEGEAVYTDAVYHKAELDLTADIAPDSEAGVVQVWCNVAGASQDLYVDSKIVVTEI